MFWSMRKVLPFVIAAFFLSSQLLGLCHGAAKTDEEPERAAKSSSPPLSADEYLASAKDKLQITIVGEKDLPTLFEVSEKDGAIKYPYIEYVRVAGLTVIWTEKFITELLRGADPKEIEKLITDLRGGADPKEIEKRLTDLARGVDPSKDGWFIDPQVNVMVQEYTQKLFYVEGQVTKPGQFTFTGQNKMTVYRAIIKAGGLTRIAKKTVILITTDEEGNEKRIEVDVSDIRKRIEGNPELDPPIKANDIVFVPESWF